MCHQVLPERLTVAGVVHRRDRCQAHARGAAQHAIEPGRAHHLDDRGHAPAGFADLPGQRGVELDLGGGVGPVAELVLEPGDAQAVMVGTGQHAGEEEAGQAARGVGEREE